MSMNMPVWMAEKASPKAVIPAKKTTMKTRIESMVDKIRPTIQLKSRTSLRYENTMMIHSNSTTQECQIQNVRSRISLSSALKIFSRMKICIKAKKKLRKKNLGA